LIYLNASIPGGLLTLAAERNEYTVLPPNVLTSGRSPEARSQADGARSALFGISTYETERAG